MLENLEKSQWITSYQLQYTGEEAACRITNNGDFYLSGFSFFLLTFSTNLVGVFFQLVTNILACFAGLGPANPPEMDDFGGKVIDHARMNSHAALVVKPNNQPV